MTQICSIKAKNTSESIDDSGGVFPANGGGFMGKSSSTIHEERETENVPEISTPNQSAYEDDKSVTLQIKEEELDIVKKWIQTGEVKAYRETFCEEKTFTIPIIREELVIEKKFFDSSASKEKDISKETIRIPLSEEQVEFTKHKVTLEDVSIYKEQVKDIKHIEEILKKEKANIKIIGSPKVREG